MVLLERYIGAASSALKPKRITLVSESQARWVGKSTSGFQGAGHRVRSRLKGTYMRVYVNDECIGCGLCEGTCPEVFTINVDGVAEAVVDIDEDFEDAVQEAADNCPAAAIEIE